MNELPSSFRFDEDDNGLSILIRKLLSRKSRSGEQQQVVTILSNWEDFGDPGDADAYDSAIRWVANHQWIIPTTHERIMRGDVGGNWFVIDRGAGTNANNKVAQEFIHHNSQENYDQWYVGSPQEESLESKIFDIRPGTPVPGAYGMLFSGGIVSQSWENVGLVLDTNLAKLARGTLHASTFETGFHDEDNTDLRKFSIGTYINPDTTFDFLIDFAKEAQAQSRKASIYEQVDTWGLEAWMGFYDNMTVATNVDVDLDGEFEYVLYNDRIYALFRNNRRAVDRRVGA